MRNIPSSDAKLVPGDIQTFCEWLVRRAGSIATCVESAEMMVNHLEVGRAVSIGEDNWLADDLLARGEASANGATNSVAAAKQMWRLGVPNDHYDAAWFASHDFVPLVKEAIDRGVPVLFGLYNAKALHDDWTNQPEDAGVQGHGITIFGYDSTGAIVGDPNTAQAERGDFVHYSWANLKAAGGTYPSMVIPRGTRAQGGVYMATPLDSYFTISASGYTLKSDSKVVVSGGELDLFKQLNGAIGLPKEPTVYSSALRAKYQDDKLAFRRYERAVMVYDPNHVKDTPPGAGDHYLGHIDDPDFGIADDEQKEAADKAAEAKQIADLNAQIDTLKAQLAQAQQSAGDSVKVQQAKDALAQALAAFTPFAQALAEVQQAKAVLG